MADVCFGAKDCRGESQEIWVAGGGRGNSVEWTVTLVQCFVACSGSGGDKLKCGLFGCSRCFAVGGTFFLPG